MRYHRLPLLTGSPTPLVNPRVKVLQLERSESCSRGGSRLEKTGFFLINPNEWRKKAKV